LWAKQPFSETDRKKRDPRAALWGNKISVGIRGQVC
jgi:hypothetical protein